MSYRESDQYKAARWRSWKFAVIGAGVMVAVGGIGKLLRAPTRFGQAWGVVIFIVALSPVWIVLVLLVRAGRKMYRLRRLQCVHCGYGMKGVPSHRCPDCGRDATG